MYEFLEWQVEDVMSEPVCIAATATLAEAERMLEERGFNALPVVDADGRLQGLLTSLDLLRAFDFSEDTILPAYHRIMQREVASVMSRDALSVTPKAPLTRVLRRLVDTRNKSFPVVDDDGRVIGVVAREDVMQALRRANRGEKPAATSS
ncbi:MAG TPA: CBS domain-containing protein [Myxococcota bacterium]|nr:CBS domain-containing protein [Myxococcota bacterium]